ncbi:uncharacterized protein LOC115212846 [Octopus sinensis]|uniref:Uncharacterized protein LOC115212846 n=1 Tax=Octopus sinensis TaxID=2607531 RepID=A0A6P7SHN9_9MOLL|nr:uncharacterized protein LOC115212846 [Octopus sinensis]
MSLNDELIDKGYNIYMDNWFSSSDLFQENKCLWDGPRFQEEHAPPSLKAETNLRKENLHTDSGLLALVWRDRKSVTMLNTMHSAAMSETGKRNRAGDPIIKPDVVLDYNRAMSGVDRSDQLATTHKSAQRFGKWYKKVFLYLVYMALMNTHLICVANAGWRSNLIRISRGFDK